nr:uncharacterized protein LOC109168426 [Ipomoea batatas]
MSVWRTYNCSITTKVHLILCILCVRGQVDIFVEHGIDDADVVLELALPALVNEVVLDDVVSKAEYDPRVVTQLESEQVATKNQGDEEQLLGDDLEGKEGDDLEGEEGDEKRFLGDELEGEEARRKYWVEDSNNQIYPIGVAVVEIENTDSWRWLLWLLKADLSITNTYQWTTISDQLKGLTHVIQELFLESKHRNCARHVNANWSKIHRGESLEETLLDVCQGYNRSSISRTT